MPSDASLDPYEFKGRLVQAPWFYRQWLLARNPALFFESVSRDLGDFVKYRGILSFYLVNHPALVKQVLKETHKNFDKNSLIYNRFRNPFGDGLVVSEGAKWSRQRRLMSPLFSPIAVRQFFDLMLDAAQSLADRWEQRCRDRVVFDIAEDMHAITLEIAGRALFHNAFDQPGASEAIARWTETINRYSAKPPIPVVTDLRFPSPTNIRLRSALRQFHLYLDALIEQRRKKGHREDLLSLLMQTPHEDSGEVMSDAEVREEVLGMIVGGHETSSAALTWTWYELHQNPVIMQQLHDELDKTLAGQAPSLESISGLTWTRMILDESMRLHPPFWFENRNVKTATELGGVALPAGAMVAFSRYSLHRNPSFWNEPEQFRPSRFDPEGPEHRRSSYAYVPFGGGPRICIGINFALMELVVILATLANRFIVHLDQSDQHKMTANLTMTPKYGVRVRLERRR